MKICLLGPVYPFRGGIAHYTTFLCRELRRRHELRVISYRRQFPGFLHPAGRSDRDPSDDRLRLDGVEFLLDFANPLTWSSTGRAIAEGEPDVVVMPWWTAYWAPHCLSVCRAIRRRRPETEIVLDCHNAVDHESNPLKRWARRRVFSQVDRLVAHSTQDAERLRRDAPDTRVTESFLPTFDGLFDEEPNKQEVRKRLDLDGAVLLFFGFVRPYKGLDIAIEALAEVPDATLVIAGKFWRGQNRVLKRVDELGLTDRVRVIDRYVTNEETADYFAACDLVLLPYRTASSSAVAQLAFGFGRPVIATAVGGLTEVIEDGANGRLTPPENPREFANAIVESLDESTLTTLMDGAVASCERYSWERAARLILGEDE